MSSSPPPPPVAGDPGALIPGLPDDVSAVILAALPFADQCRLRATSRRWRALLSPTSVLRLRRRLRLPRRHLLALFPGDPSLYPPCLFDPSASSPAWRPLPPLPCSPHVYGLSNFVPVALGPNLYVLGGSHFDAHSYPLGHPLPSAAAHRLDLSSSPPLLSWRRLTDMLLPRGSFACASQPKPGEEDDAWGTKGVILVAGGGSRHAMFPSEGSRTSAVEYYDVETGEWRPMRSSLPELRAGCVGFLVRRRDDGNEEEFWVMGGYGEYQTVGGVVPSDKYKRDAVALRLSSGLWRDMGDTWEEGERVKLGAVATVEGEDGRAKEIFMLEMNDIFRFDFSLNRWLKVCTLRRKIPTSGSCIFIAMNGELYILSSSENADASNARRGLKRRATVDMQVYNPVERKWRFLTTNPPLQHPIHFKIAVACTIAL